LRPPPFTSPFSPPEGRVKDCFLDDRDPFLCPSPFGPPKGPIQPSLHLHPRLFFPSSRPHYALRPLPSFRKPFHYAKDYPLHTPPSPSGGPRGRLSSPHRSLCLKAQGKDGPLFSDRQPGHFSTLGEFKMGGACSMSQSSLSPFPRIGIASLPSTYRSYRHLEVTTAWGYSFTF